MQDILGVKNLDFLFDIKCSSNHVLVTEYPEPFGIFNSDKMLYPN